MEEKFLQAEEPEAERNSPFRTRRNLNSSSKAKSFDGFDVSLLKGRNTFAKDEKLKSNKIIDQLFQEGKSVSSNGFTLVYLARPLHTFYPAQAGFSVPKKHFKLSVDRNRIKRLMREAYRNNKIPLYKKLVEREKQMAIMFVYKGKELPRPEIVVQALTISMNRIFI